MPLYTFVSRIGVKVVLLLTSQGYGINPFHHAFASQFGSFTRSRRRPHAAVFQQVGQRRHPEAVITNAAPS